MALIYANAVNKRMNNPISKPKKKHTLPCSFLDESPTGSARGDGRKRSTSRETTPLRKVSCNIPLHLQANYSNAESHHSKVHTYHRPVQRSKTSCGELSNKDQDDDIPRKTSHPAISQSATSDALCGRRAEDKRALAKRSLIQKYNLEHVYDESVRQSEERRRSISLDPEQWFEQVTGHDKTLFDNVLDVSSKHSYRSTLSRSYSIRASIDLNRLMAAVASAHETSHPGSGPARLLRRKSIN